MDKYYYLFFDGDKKPRDIKINDEKKDYVSFGDGSAVDWCFKDREVDGNGIDILVDVVISAPELPQPYIQTLDEAKQQQLSILNQSAQQAYIAGFLSSASGSPMWYDSDGDTQTVINRLYADAKYAPAVFTTSIYMQGVPAGQVPIRAKLTKDCPDASKTVQYLTVSQMITLGNDMAANWASVKSQHWAKQAAVDTAYKNGDIAAIKAVTW